MPLPCSCLIRQCPGHGDQVLWHQGGWSARPGNLEPLLEYASSCHIPTFSNPLTLRQTAQSRVFQGQERQGAAHCTAPGSSSERGAGLRPAARTWGLWGRVLGASRSAPYCAHPSVGPDLTR